MRVILNTRKKNSDLFTYYMLGQPISVQDQTASYIRTYGGPLTTHFLK